jgi:hypothetical protein
MNMYVNLACLVDVALELYADHHDVGGGGADLLSVDVHSHHLQIWTEKALAYLFQAHLYWKFLLWKMHKNLTLALLSLTSLDI